MPSKVLKATAPSAKASVTKAPVTKAKGAKAKGARGASAAIGPVGCSSFKLRQLSRRVSQQFDRLVGNTGLKTTQYSLLTHVMRLAPVRPVDLAADMEMDASTLTRNLQPLISQGWLDIGPGADGRSRFVTITDAGRDKRAEAQREWKRAQLAFNAQVGEERVAALHALIDECLVRMHESAHDSADESPDGATENAGAVRAAVSGVRANASA